MDWIPDEFVAVLIGILVTSVCAWRAVGLLFLSRHNGNSGDSWIDFGGFGGGDGGGGGE